MQRSGSKYISSKYNSHPALIKQVEGISSNSVIKGTMHEETNNLTPAELYFPKEISWLSFNERVLQEAADKSVPIIERLRYLGIFSNNLDEYFRVRVADVRRLATFTGGSKKEHYKQLMDDIQHNVVRLQHRFDAIYLEVLSALRQCNIYVINEFQLNIQQQAFVEDFFQHTVLPELDPIILSENRRIPIFADASIHLAVKITSSDSVRYSLLEVPTDRIDRFIQIPQKQGKKGRVYIVLENIIRHCLPKVFRGIFPVEKAEAYTIKLTRDAELELDEDISQSLINKIFSSLKKRRKADPVRFVYDSDMPKDLLEFITKEMGLGKYDSLTPGGRYHNSKDFMSFPNVGPKHLEFNKLPNIPIKAIEQSVNIFDCLREQDILLYYPYHSFNCITDTLQTAAIDPAVKSIQICLYRVAKHSRVVDALLSAVTNNKDVTAVVELQARFDEEANISWAQRLTEGGVNVIFGIPGLKVHSKLFLITRKETNGQRYYSHIGTGNFNEKTAQIYTDFSLLTYNQEIGHDVASVFDFIRYTYRRHHYKHLLVSPHSSRSGLVNLIDNEIQNAEKGLQAGIMIKCNNLVDNAIINKLYEASQVGVDIKLIIRGMCSLVPGIKNISENISIISIVDRFLEHPRVFIFHNNGAPRYYISSADLMTRNLDYRVEVCCPIYDHNLQQCIQNILDIQWHDNVKARIVDKTQSNELVSKKTNTKIRSQVAIEKYLRKNKMPRFKKKNAKQAKSRNNSSTKTLIKAMGDKLETFKTTLDKESGSTDHDAE